MASIYRSEAGQQLVRRWCADQLDRWPVPHERTTVAAAEASTHAVSAGSGPGTVVFVAGTNFNASSSLPLATALVEAGHRVVLLDVPGQPGLSSGECPRGGLPWYGAWLSEALEQLHTGRVTVLGHSLGAGIALSSESPLVDRLVLVSPGGLTRLRVTPKVLAASATWYLRPTEAHSARLLRAMHAPGHEPRAELVEWMTLIARHARSSASPGKAPLPSTPRQSLAVVGEHDTFMPPRILAPAVRTAVGTDLHVIADAGHLVVEEHPQLVAGLVDTVTP
ncbi:alpha/beta fold hydrolase [Streptomyces luteolus]|uniref:Alpha/beta fold hydrolase n=1 Tax=Streptomyces luteolus TaxID=3043615 RepID=A0ABT6T5P6_9ACTN|nr:alpha/beta fold hydrolase [Streptomyces sp. B-S-A12]MDI3422708.1 alpha/beta fold hydrolase [Streptomyces sp. B-S-A12]